MKKSLHRFLALMCAAALCLSTAAISVSAADTSVTESNGFSMELSDAVFMDRTEETPSITPRLNLNTNAPALASGAYRYYYTSTGEYFSLEKNDVVSVTVKTSVNSSLKIGYYKRSTGSKYTVYTSTSRSKSHSTTITIPSDDDYSIWIYNNGSDSFTVSGGSITY